MQITWGGNQEKQSQDQMMIMSTIRECFSSPPTSNNSLRPPFGDLTSKNTLLLGPEHHHLHTEYKFSLLLTGLITKIIKTGRYMPQDTASQQSPTCLNSFQLGHLSPTFGSLQPRLTPVSRQVSPHLCLSLPKQKL